MIHFDYSNLPIVLRDRLETLDKLAQGDTSDFILTEKELKTLDEMSQLYCEVPLSAYLMSVTSLVKNIPDIAKTLDRQESGDVQKMIPDISDDSIDRPGTTYAFLINDALLRLKTPKQLKKVKDLAILSGDPALIADVAKHLRFIFNKNKRRLPDFEEQLKQLGETYIDLAVYFYQKWGEKIEADIDLFHIFKEQPKPIRNHQGHDIPVYIAPLLKLPFYDDGKILKEKMQGAGISDAFICQFLGSSGFLEEGLILAGDNLVLPETIK